MQSIATLLLAIVAMATSSSAFSVAPRCVSVRTGMLFMSDDASNAAAPFTGTVKWYNTMKGFGFIVPDDEDAGDVFVHHTAIKSEGFRSLADGERVEYKVETDASGRTRAVAVTGPGGADVEGAPFRPSSDFDSY